MHVEEMLERYIVALVTATRRLEAIDASWRDYLIAGASPRASIALLRAASALAYLRGRDYVIPEDIMEMVPDVLRHRIVTGYAARADKVTPDHILRRILEHVPVP
jgi:MoxR-like ATPase